MIRERDEKYYLERKFILPEILKSILKRGIIDDDSVWYNKKDFNFSSEDYIENWNFLMDLDTREDKSSNIKDMVFLIERSYFEIDNIKFMLNVMSGQGSIFSFYLDGKFKDVFFEERFKIELSMDYSELEFPNWIQKQIKEYNDLEKAMDKFFVSEDGQKFIKSLGSKIDGI
jgi:hypothetical protein